MIKKKNMQAYKDYEIVIKCGKQQVIKRLKNNDITVIKRYETYGLASLASSPARTSRATCHSPPLNQKLWGE